MSDDPDEKFAAAARALHGDEYQKPSLDPKKRCLGCGRPMVLRKRPITSSAAVSLIYLYRHARQTGSREFQYLEGFMKKSWPGHQRGDETKLACWGLLEPRAPVTGKRAWDGYWRITDKGMRFVEGLELPRYVYLFNKSLYGFSDGREYEREMGTITDALATPFSLENLLSGNWTPPPKGARRRRTPRAASRRA